MYFSDESSMKLLKRTFLLIIIVMIIFSFWPEYGNTILICWVISHQTIKEIEKEQEIKELREFE